MRNTQSFLFSFSLSLVLATLFVATPTHAQEVEESLQSQSAETAPEEAVAETDDEIVVTARRREELLQDTPVAVSVFTAELLEARQVGETMDLERITPSLQFKPAGQLSGNTAATVVFIRGIGQLDPTAAVDPGVGIYIDEVYVGRAVGGLIDFGDIAGVEVLRGPQGTLFGRNTIGGAILVRTREPEFGERSGRVHLGVGEDNLYNGLAALNLPISDTAAARFSVGFRQRDGYVTRAFDGLDLGNEESLPEAWLGAGGSDPDRLAAAPDGSRVVFSGITLATAREPFVVDIQLFADGFESGSTSAWSSTVP